MVRWPEWDNAMVTPEAKQRMLTNVWRESYMRLFKTLEQAQTDRDLYQKQAERLADALEVLLSLDNHHAIKDFMNAKKAAHEALEEYKLAQ